MTHRTPRRRPAVVRAALCAALVAVALSAPNLAQTALDICGCANVDADNSATYPPGTTGCAPGTTCNGATITFAVPPDGVLKFSSVLIDGDFSVRFSGVRPGVPVTFLVAGDMRLAGRFCCFTLDISGANGSSGSTATAGVGGQPGPGGFRGGDGASLPINLATIGGAGFGPGGGNGGDPATGSLGAQGGTFFGLPELLPLVGGSGGGGGGSNGTTASCSGGGGGGGGGALLIAVNGTLTLSNFQMFADGGSGGGPGNGACAAGGGGGAGGAIRIVAGRMVEGGTGQLLARAGGGSSFSSNGTAGRIRLESLDNSAQTAFSGSQPAPLRIAGPGPLFNPLLPKVTITTVGGAPVPESTTGATGGTDIVLPTPGPTTIGFRTSGVPSGTTVLVTVKPRINGAPVSATVPLVNCDGTGVCNETAVFNLAAGAAVVEARATFQVPGP